MQMHDLPMLFSFGEKGFAVTKYLGSCVGYENSCQTLTSIILLCILGLDHLKLNYTQLTQFLIKFLDARVASGGFSGQAYS